MTSSLLSLPQPPKEKDKVSFFPIIAVLLAFSFFSCCVLAVCWFLYQNWFTQVVVQTESQSSYFERDSQRHRQDKILQKYLPSAIDSVLRFYAPSNPSNPAATTAPHPHTGPANKRFKIFPPLPLHSKSPPKGLSR